MPPAEKKRHALSAEMKQKICQYYVDHPKIKQKELATLFNLQNARSTLTKVLNNKEKWLQQDFSGNAGEKTRLRQCKYPRTMEAISIWVMAALNNNQILSGAIIQQKAIFFSQAFPDELGFKASEGWLTTFKDKHGIRSYIHHGEANSAPLADLPTERANLQELLSQYSRDDIYNADESGLFFRLLPNRSLATSQTSGVKRDKERITILLACNSSGTHKLKPLIIGKARRPLALRSVNMNSLPVTYRWNSKAWMNGELFQEWLKGLDAMMARRQRKILLLIDNAPCHATCDMENVKVHFLPPNTTSHLQPLDGGIIKSFKAHYRKFHLQFLIDKYDDGLPNEKLTIKDAIYFAADAWNEVTPATIHNCWNHVDILPGTQLAMEPDSSLQDTRSEIQCLIDQLNVPFAKMTAQQYLEIDSNTPAHDIPSDPEIIEEVNNIFDSQYEDTDDPDEEPLPRMSAVNGRDALENTIRWCEQLEENLDEKFLRTLRFLLRDAQRKVHNEKKQISIDVFLNKN